MRFPARRRGLCLDAETLEQLYAAHATRMTAYFARRLRTPEDALDLTAETFARAYKSRSRFAGQVEDEAVAWLFGIARNLLLQHLRDGQIHLRALTKLGLERRPITDDQLEELFSQDLGEDLEAALEALPQAQREAVELRVLAELEYAEVAELTGVSEQAARARVSRGLRTIGTLMKGDRG